MSVSEVPEGFSEWEMVVTGSSSSSSDSSVEDGGSAEEDLKSGSEVPDGGIGRRLRFCFEVMRTGVFHLGSKVHDFAGSGAGFWSIVSVSRVVVVAVSVAVLYRKIRQWCCQLREERNRRLDLLIRDKDEKINKLLLQVVHLNKQLSARHSVPVQHQRVPIPVIRVRAD